jgi:predicted GH43/DUF377 family glycosyl hydrolase
MDIKNLGVILKPTDKDFENQAVLNPGCITVDGITHMFYRAVRQGNYSCIGYCRLQGTAVIYRSEQPIIVSEYDFEKHGVEDPRIVLVDGTYYMFYAAYDGKNAHTAYATSNDLQHFEKRGLITPSFSYAEAIALLPALPLLEKYVWYGKHYEEAIATDVELWEKDTFVFPKKINGKFLLLTRVMPGIQIFSCESLVELTDDWWKDRLRSLDKYILMQPHYWFETRKIGCGCPPIETSDGWLLIYHGVEDSPHGNVYRAGAALLDLTDPTKVIARLPEPLFSPTESWETSGTAANVVFPTAALCNGDMLTIFYGAADSYIAAKQLSLNELLNQLKQHPV